MGVKDQLILNGWQDCADACGISAQAMKRRAKRYKMPYVRMCGKVTISKTALMEWVNGLCELVERDGGRDDYVTKVLKNFECGKRTRKRGVDP